MWEVPRWKVLFSYNEGIYIAKGEKLTLMTLWLPSWLFDFLWLFDFTWLLNFICGSLGLPMYITLITTSMAHCSDVVETTHETTRHEIVYMYWLTVVLVSNYCVVEWWYALSVTCFHLHMARCVGSSTVLVFSWWCMCMCLFHLLLDVLHAFIRLWESLIACALSSSHSLLPHVSSMHLFLKSLMMRWHLIKKSLSLTRCIVFHFDVHYWERDKALKLCRSQLRPRCETLDHCWENLCRFH